jgi:Ca-activated chloride channel family protein
MISQLREIDRITIITYSDKAKVLVSTTPADEKESLYKSIDTLRASGGTAGSKGLDLAYVFANSSYIKDANNQIILATDGSFSLKTKDEKTIKKYARSNNSKITLTTVGFGSSRADLKALEQLSKLGKGNYIYINSLEIADSAILDEIKNNSKR